MGGDRNHDQQSQARSLISGEMGDNFRDVVDLNIRSHHQRQRTQESSSTPSSPSSASISNHHDGNHQHQGRRRQQQQGEDFSSSFDNELLQNGTPDNNNNNEHCVVGSIEQILRARLIDLGIKARRLSTEMSQSITSSEEYRSSSLHSSQQDSTVVNRRSSSNILNNQETSYQNTDNTVSTEDIITPRQTEMIQRLRQLRRQSFGGGNSESYSSTGSLSEHDSISTLNISNHYNSGFNILEEANPQLSHSPNQESLNSDSQIKPNESNIIPAPVSATTPEKESQPLHSSNNYDSIISSDLQTIPNEATITAVPVSATIPTKTMNLNTSEKESQPLHSSNHYDSIISSDLQTRTETSHTTADNFDTASTNLTTTSKHATDTLNSTASLQDGKLDQTIEINVTPTTMSTSTLSDLRSQTLQKAKSNSTQTIMYRKAISEMRSQTLQKAKSNSTSKVMSTTTLSDFRSQTLQKAESNSTSKIMSTTSLSSLRYQTLPKTTSSDTISISSYAFGFLNFEDGNDDEEAPTIEDDASINAYERINSLPTITNPSNSVEVSSCQCRNIDEKDDNEGPPTIDDESINVDKSINSLPTTTNPINSLEGSSLDALSKPTATVDCPFQYLNQIHNIDEKCNTDIPTRKRISIATIDQISSRFDYKDSDDQYDDDDDAHDPKGELLCVWGKKCNYSDDDYSNYNNSDDVDVDFSKAINDIRDFSETSNNIQVSPDNNFINQNDGVNSTNDESYDTNNNNYSLASGVIPLYQDGESMRRNSSLVKMLNIMNDLPTRWVDNSIATSPNRLVDNNIVLTPLEEELENGKSYHGDESQQEQKQEQTLPQQESIPKKKQENPFPMIWKRFILAPKK